MTEKVEPKKAGRPKGSLGRTKSKLRKTEASLMKMNDSAVEVIQRSLDGEKVDSGKLATAKWVVTTSVTVSRAAIAEETALNVGIPRASGDEEEEKDEQYAALSLTVVR